MSLSFVSLNSFIIWIVRYEIKKICLALHSFRVCFDKKIIRKLFFRMLEEDDLYLSYSELMARSCHTGVNEEDEEENDEDAGKSFEVGGFNSGCWLVL